jgi:hypothetical protein
VVRPDPALTRRAKSAPATVTGALLVSVTRSR